ncbi:hypothetical protein MMC07_001673 [Pseudocyphellaria aurata]|nr:hypothetical protein [Pseudocyphellaria aurata]
MTVDYVSHPAELVIAGEVNQHVGIKELRNAIPARCFKPSYRASLGYLFRDLVVAVALMYTAFVHIPQIETLPLRYVAWGLYGCIEGLFFVGLWVLGHECGHMAFSPSRLLNDTVGFMVHSALLTPYFSWKSTHRRHHIYANNLAMDHNYVPPRRAEYASSLLFDVSRLEELTEDSPVVTFARIILQQVLGWPWYLMTNITAAPSSLPKPPSKKLLGNGHLAPTGSLFRAEEALLIFLSDLGLAATAFGLWYATSRLGVGMVALLYLQPYLWVNHWIVAITYLHHTHPALPKFEPEAWTFMKGATATVDREFGWIGKHLFHGIIEFHVIHHFFSRIPFYHAEEATKAIIPLLGASYHSDKQRAFLPGLWESFTKCQWVEPDDPAAEPEERKMRYKGGPSPPPESSMGKKSWVNTSTT